MVRLEYRELRFLISERWVECCRVTTLPLLWVVIPLDVVELLYILRATSKVCWVQ
jgi:hypothetical protein